MLEGLLVVGALVLGGVSFAGGLSSRCAEPFVNGDTRFEAFLRKWPTYRFGKWLVESEGKPKE